MSDRHYLAKVLGMSVAPRVFTSVLTLVSFPLLLRAVGATEYGVIIYLTAVVAVFESFADFGVSSAAGKMIAAARVQRPSELGGEIGRWAQLQALVALLGVLPLFGLSYLYVRYAGSMRIPTPVVMLMVGASWISICSSFARAGIRSCLDFKALMVIDTVESVTRSATWLIAARIAPTAFGVAAAALTTGVVVSATCVLLLILVVRRQQRILAGSAPHTNGNTAPLNRREMVRESIHFLGLRVSVRMTQAVPIVVIEKVVGAAVVGVIGAFARITEILGFPFGVIGNALSVRAQEVLLKNRAAIVALWDTVLRFAALAGAVAAGLVLISEPITELLLPGNREAAPLIAILSTTVLSAAVAAMVGPMADYVGALPRRVTLIAAIVIGEIPLLFAGGRLFGPIGAVAAYALALAFTSVGFAIIAKRAFFGAQHYRPAADIGRFCGGVIAALAAAWAIGAITPVSWTPLTLAVVRVACYVTILGLIVILTPSVRNAMLGGSLFDFTANAGIPPAIASGQSDGLDVKS